MPSPWFAKTPDKLRYPALRGRVEADVVVIGAGVAGVLTAWRLAERGARVVLLEKNHVATGDTGYTTAFVTRVPDTSLVTLTERYGAAYVRDLFAALGTAQDWLRTTLRQQHVECDWRDCWSYNCSYQAGNATLAAEWAVAHQADPRASFVRGRDVAAANPAAAEAIRYDGEARFDARAALVGLLATETGKHIKIFEESAVTEVVFDDKARGAPGVTVKTPTGQVHAATAIMTTGRPLEQFAELHPLLTAQVTYALTAYYTGKLPISDDVFWDTDEPYQYYRRLGQDTLILGGADHLADEPPPEEAPHEQLEKFLRHKLPGGGEIRVTRTWSGSLFYTEDGVPYIGRHPRHPNLLIATGFGGAGMVPGALAALTLADLALAPTSPHAAPASGAAKLLAFERTGKALPLPAPLPQQPPVSGTTPPGWRRALITTLRILLPLVFIAALVTPAVVFFSDRGGTSFLAGADLQTFSILMFPLVGLYAFTLLWVQFLLGSSMYPLKAIFPRVELFHRTEGVFVLLFALTHPTLILLGTGSLATYLQYKFVAPNLVPWAYVGEVQLTLLILTVATALLRKTKWLKSRWHYIHYANYVVFTLAWLHSYNLGTDVQSHLAWLWYFYGATALLSAGARLYHEIRNRRLIKAGVAPVAAGAGATGTGTNGTWVAVAPAGKVVAGKPVCVVANGAKLALFKVEEEFYAITNTCSHQGGPLCEGSANGNVVTCPWHGSKFNVQDGSVVGGPARLPIKTYKTRVRAGQVEVLA